MITTISEDAGRCYECFRSKKACLCDEIRTFDNQVRIVILIHPKEAKKQRVGTGRLTQKSLTKSEMILGVDFTHDGRVNALINDPFKDCYLLYPGSQAVNLSRGDKLPLESEKEIVIFVLDGTWPCAKKMLKLSKNLQDIKRVCFESSEKSLFSIKHQPSQYCLSTIESVALLLKELQEQGAEAEGDGPAEMVGLLEKMVKFQRDCAADPERPGYRRKPYSDQRHRESFIRPKSRLFYYDDKNFE